MSKNYKTAAASWKQAFRRGLKRTIAVAAFVALGILIGLTDPFELLRKRFIGVEADSDQSTADSLDVTPQ